AEDGIRDKLVTGVQKCALPISEAIVGGTVPRQYIPGVEKGVREALDHGPAAGFPVVNVKVTLIDGAYHTVDSNEMAFKIASSQRSEERRVGKECRSRGWTGR